MKPLCEDEVFASFVNCTEADLAKVKLPDWFADAPWDDLDFLGWKDPSTPMRGYLVADGGLVGVRLRFPHEPGSAKRTSMCGLCLTVHPPGGVSLVSVPKAGGPAAQLSTVGIYMCSDLQCSLYLRGIKNPGRGSPTRETLDPRSKVLRLRENLARFLVRVAGDVMGGVITRP